MNNKLRLISYGILYDENKFTPIKNETPSFNKPMGGLFACKYRSNRYDWKKWCIDNKFNTDKLKIYTIFSLLPIAKIITINDFCDLKTAINVYTFDDGFRGIDFEKLSEDYDAIHITERAVCECRYLSDRFYADLYTWDIDSYCIFNKNIIDKNSIRYRGEV